LKHLRKEVEKDRYRMRAFVRFRRVLQQDEEWYVAWYTPEHRTLDLNAQFFLERFRGMRWAILTRYATMQWDLAKLSFGPGVPASTAPAEDVLEELWRTYYRSIYNPGRLNLDAMRAQLPVRRWAELPESRAIPELVRLSRGAMAQMRNQQRTSAAEFIPPDARLPVLRSAIESCRACELCMRASGAVFGEGPASARIAFVGEQPGDEEDRERRPFVGPAGKVFDSALAAAGLERNQVYVTNAVKAFKFEHRGKRRVHATPKPAEIAACRPWLLAELAAVKPAIVVCLGASAAQSVLGRVVRVGEERVSGPTFIGAQRVHVSFHPSAILRRPDAEQQREMFRCLVDDIRCATAENVVHSGR
jgi:DNA polymerase